MKRIVNWKSFFILLAVCVIGSILVMPFQTALSPALAELWMKLYIAAIVQSLIIFPPAIFFGLILAKKTGFSLPILEGENKRKCFIAILTPSILRGAFGGVLVILLSLPFWGVSLELLKAEMAVPTWAGFLAALYGGVAEEVLFRLFLMSLFVWIAMKIKIPRNVGVWAAIIITGIIFGLGHLPITGELTAITSDIVLRAILLNGSVSIIFGWLYWKKGLESAMIAHFSVDMVLHVITPLVARLFI